MRIGRVREIWRYPVKSMGGERVEQTTLDGRGVHGDRLWVVRDEDKGANTNAKRIPSLLLLRARYVSEPAADVGPGSIPAVVITFPDGAEASSADADIDARLSAFLGKRVTLQALRPATDTAFYKRTTATIEERREHLAVDADEPMPDFAMVPAAVMKQLETFATPPGTFFDAFGLHVVTSASLGDFDARRFRANVVIDTEERGSPELEWTGSTLALGAAAAFVDCPTPRCSMPTRAQVDGVPADKSVLKMIPRDADRCLGAYATVTTSGALSIGDDVSLTPPDTTELGAWAKQRAAGLQAKLRAAMAK